MTKRFRRVLFYSSLVIFLLASFVVILYAQGYKYSFREGRFLRTGAISLNVNTGATVYVNDQLKGSTSLIGNTVGIDGLLPGVYSVRIQRDGYSTWLKDITAYEGLVADFPHVLLLPLDETANEELLAEVKKVFAAKPAGKEDEFLLRQRSLFQITENKQMLLATNVRGFALSSDSSRILWWTNNEIWVRWLSDTNYQPLKVTGNQELIIKSAATIKRAAWFRGTDHIVFETNGYRIAETDTRGEVNVIKL